MKNDYLPELDLLYPTQEKRSEAALRSNRIAELPQDYVANLEVERLAEILCHKNQHFTVGLLTELCTDAETINYRLDIIEDFRRVPALLPKLFGIILKMLENDRRTAYNLNSVSAFSMLSGSVEDLKSYAECVDDLYAFYEVKKEIVRSKGLQRLFEKFSEIYRSEDFKQLKENLAELDKALADRIKSVTVAINFDEDMRPIATGVVSYSKEPYVKKPSLFDKLLYSKGAYSKNVVELELHERYIKGDQSLPNELEEKLFKDLEKLTSKYIAVLTEAMSAAKRMSFTDVMFLDSQLEFYSGEVALIELAESKGIKMCRPKILPMEERRAEFKGVYDLCLFKKAVSLDLNARGEELVIDNDLSMNDDARFFILTGANNGGKTTFTRAVGISQLFAQCGLYVPAESAEISIVDFIYCHFPKEEEVGINTSRFTNEIKEFKTISDTATRNSMLLMNESIQSTTPKECLSIAEEVVRVFSIIGVRGIFATHLVDLAYKIGEINADPDNKSRLESIVVGIDESTKKRLYKVEKGLPPSDSSALSVFKQYGISLEQIRNRK